MFHFSLHEKKNQANIQKSKRLHLLSHSCKKRRGWFSWFSFAFILCKQPLLAVWLCFQCEAILSSSHNTFLALRQILCLRWTSSAKVFFFCCWPDFFFFLRWIEHQQSSFLSLSHQFSRSGRETRSNTILRRSVCRLQPTFQVFPPPNNNTHIDRQLLCRKATHIRGYHLLLAPAWIVQ